MNINYKNGLSQVVTSVILILLVLVAIGIIWAFTANFIEKESKDITSSAVCLEISLEVTRFTIEDRIDDDVAEYYITVRKGSENIIVQELAFILENNDKERIVILSSEMPLNISLAPLEIKTFMFNKDIIAVVKEEYSPSKVSVAAVINGKLCNPTAPKQAEYITNG